jgi:hypothetical protein
MSNTGVSVLAFSVYLGILGFVLVFIPGPLLTLLGLPLAEDYWILIAGMLLLGLSMYYAFAAKENLISFMRHTAIMRLLILPYFLVLVLINMAPPPILILGAIDLFFAGWTFVALRLDQSPLRPHTG